MRLVLVVPSLIRLRVRRAMKKSTEIIKNITNWDLHQLSCAWKLNKLPGYNSEDPVGGLHHVSVARALAQHACAH
jgi:hypothetical protein